MYQCQCHCGKIYLSYDRRSVVCDNCKTNKECPACDSLLEYDINMKPICSYCQTEELAKKDEK